VNIKRNFIIGLLNSSWAALSGLIVVPVYIKYLGVEAYGLVGFFTMLQIAFSFMDFGLTPTVNREISRSSSLGKITEARNLLYTLEFFYGLMAIFIAGLVMIAAPYIAHNWLNASDINSHELAKSIILMGVVIACRWPLALYHSALIGLQRLNVSSYIGILITTISSFGAVATVVFIRPSIDAFFIWQAFIAVLSVFSVRLVTWGIIGRDGLDRFHLNRLKKIWRFSAGVSVVGLTGMVLMQLDKVLLSKMLSLEDFGKYSLATVLSMGLYVMLTPLFNTIYPKFSSLVVKEEISKLVYLYKKSTRIFLAFFLPVAITFSIFSKDILFIWTGDIHLAGSVAPIASLVIIGTALNGIMHFPYALQLAYGKVAIAIKINIFLISVMLPLTIIFTFKFGAVGGGLSWATLNFLYLIFGTLLTHKYLLKGVGFSWFFEDVMFPLVMSIIICGGGGYIVKTQEFNSYSNLSLGIFFVFLTFVIILKKTQNIQDLLASFGRVNN
jgi:O-antigen/teichoic acid export membrane protein